MDGSSRGLNTASVLAGRAQANQGVGNHRFRRLYEKLPSKNLGKHCREWPAGKTRPAVTFDGAVVERTRHLRNLGIHFDIMLTNRKHVETTALKCKKGLSVLKAMATKGIEQCHLFLLYQSVVLSVIVYGRGLTTMAQTNLLKLD